MGNIIHICFSATGGCILKQAVKVKKILEGKKVIVFSDDLSQGKIRKIINTDERIAWWNKIDKEEAEGLEDSYNKFYKEISEIKDSDVIYIWYWPWSSEICGMMHALELLKDKVSNAYFINISNNTEETENDKHENRPVSEMITEKLNSCIKLKRKIELVEHDALIYEWNTLKEENSLLRVLVDGKIKSVNENYFDTEILKHTEKEFNKVTRAVGSAIGSGKAPISNSYLYWRVQELVNLGMIEFKEELDVIEKMEIKITEKGLEYLNKS